MPDFKFDLETFVRAYMDLKKEWQDGSRACYEFWDSVTRAMNDKDSNVSVHKALGNYKDIKSGTVKNVLKYMDDVKGKPEARDVTNTIRFVAEQVFFPKQNGNGWGSVEYYDNTTYMQMFLNRMKSFKDKQLVYDVLKHFQSFSGYYQKPAEAVYNNSVKNPAKAGVYKDIATMLANNENATLDDIAEMIYFVETPDEALKIINDVFARTDEELDKELSKDVPGTDRVRNILAQPSSVVHMVLNLKQLNPSLQKILNVRDESNDKFFNQLRQWSQMANNKYDFNKVIGSGDAQYVTNYENTLEQENIDLLKENDVLTKQNSTLEKSRDQFRDNFDREKLLNKKMEQRYNDERAARLSVEKMLQKALEVIDAYEKGEADVDKAGVFNKGAAKVKMKKQVEDAQDELKRAKAEEAKRVAALVARQREAGDAISI